jgi:hypothetical protein
MGFEPVPRAVSITLNNSRASLTLHPARQFIVMPALARGVTHEPDTTDFPFGHTGYPNPERR